jgi:hypothetical protein
MSQKNMMKNPLENGLRNTNFFLTNSLKLKVLHLYMSFVATLALGSQPKQRGYKVAGQEEA